MRFRTLALAVVVASACSAGSESTAPVGDPLRSGTSATVPAGTLALSVAAEPQGTSVRILVTVRNVSGAAVTLDFPTTCTSDYEVLDMSNRSLGTSEQMCGQAETQRTLAPGASYTDAHEWGRGHAGPQVAAGTYRVRGLLHTGVSRMKPTGDQTITSSNVVTVTLP